ncbi:MAG TPA: matrixin family metalloprotease [Solirubrobacteraceae bacterium]|nr:matrixin family metalloprotease [Solirubrobacteraceae bacterium]
MRAGWILVLALVALLTASAPASARVVPFDGPAAGGAQAHAAFKLAGWRWSRGRITYYNGAHRSGWSVHQAVKAWNRSGARVKFVAAGRSRARLVIRYHRARGCLPYAYAQPLYDGSGRVARAEVVIPRPHARNAFCTRWGQALVVAHELGHVLGLGHESRRCATMNPQTTGLTPGECPLQPEWRWHCGLLEADDVRGAVRIYGGRVKPRPPRLCDLIGPPAPVTDLTATPVGEGQVDIAFTRPPQPSFPAHVSGQPEAYGVAMAAGTCPPPDPWTPRWNVAVGGRQAAQLYADAPGPHCVSVWAYDRAGRRSTPATVTVEVT